MKKTYKLQYEQHKTLHALADRSVTLNRLTLPARAFKEVSDLFSTRAEELTLAVENGDLLLTSFTESVVFDKEVLKQPIFTSVRIDNKEFSSIDVDEDEQITFCVREFKAVAALCDLLNIDIEVLYGEAGRPMIVDFNKDGLAGQLIVATTAAGIRHSNKSATGIRKVIHSQHQPRIISREASRQNPSQDLSEIQDRSSRMPAWHDESVLLPSQSRTEEHIETPEVPRHNAQQDAPLFAPDPDEETRGEAEDVIPEPAREESDPSIYRLSHSYAHEQASNRPTHMEDFRDDMMEPYEEPLDFPEDEEPIGPTQPVSQRMKGLFD